MLRRGSSEFEIRNRSIVMKEEDNNGDQVRPSNIYQVSRSTEILTQQNGSEEKIQLKREVGLFSAVSLIVGVMIGSGIFVSPSIALKRAGSISLCLIIWALCGVISLLGALCFAELGLLVPRSGAEYVYFQEAYGKLHKFWGPLPSFICFWVYVMVLRPAEAAIIILTFSEYICQSLELYTGAISVEYRGSIIKLVSLLALGLLTYINFASVKLFVYMQNMFTISKLTVCVIIIIVGLYALSSGNTKNISTGFEDTNRGAEDIVLAFYSCLWSYDGWSTVTSITEEVKRPERNILLSLVIAVPVVTVVYCMTNVAYMTVLPKSDIIASTAVAVTFGEKMLGVMSFIIPLGVALSTFGCALSLQFSVTRLCFVSAREGHMMEAFSYIHMHRLTPAPSVVLQGVLSMLFILSGDIAELIDFANFLIWTFYALAMIALLILHKAKKDVDRPFKVHILIPIFMIFVALFLILVPIITDPTPKYFIAIGLIGIGFIVYTPLIYYKHQPKKLINKFTYFIQVLFEVVPPEKQLD